MGLQVSPLRSLFESGVRIQWVRGFCRDLAVILYRRLSVHTISFPLVIGWTFLTANCPWRRYLLGLEYFLSSAISIFLADVTEQPFIK